MWRDKDQNHGAPDTSVSGAYPFLGLVTGVQSVRFTVPRRPRVPAASPHPPLSLPARLMAPADTAADDRLFAPPYRYRSTLFQSPHHRGENLRALVNDHG